MTREQIRELAARVAAEMKAVGTARLPEDLRRRFIEVRAALFQRGLYDPVLVRFDSATVPKASTPEIADQLLLAASSL